MSTPCIPCGGTPITTGAGSNAACQPGPRGPAGPTGPAGLEGSNGQHARASLQGSFTMPAVGSAITLDIANGSWIGVGQIVYVETAGYFSAAAPSQFNVTLTNLGYGPNVAPGTIVSAPALISPAGPKGANAQSDAVGYILIRRELSPGTNNGGFTAGGWVARLLNTTVTDTRGLLVSLDPLTGIFKLKPGKYKIRAEAPGYSVNKHRSRVRNVTSGGPALYGTSEFTGNLAQSSSLVLGRLDLAVETELILESKCSVTQGTNGRGVAADFEGPEVYEFVELTEVH